MKLSINKIYIITNDDSKFDKIKNRLKNKNNIKIIKCSPIDYNDIKENVKDKITTEYCSQLCSKNTISNWLTHVYLWKKIYQNKEDNVLIIENNGMPIKSFYNLLEEYSKELPKKWDMLYFGCTGSCDSSLVNDTYFKLLENKSNEDVLINGKKMIFVMKPGFPLGLYGYMLSKSGIKKLATNENLNKVCNNLDYHLSKNIFDDVNMKVYAFNPPLINYVKKNNKINNHELLEPFTKNIKLSKYNDIDSMWNTELYNINVLNVKITYFTIVLLLISFISGYLLNQNNEKIFIASATILNMFEIAFTKTNKGKIKTILFELLLVYLFFALGVYFKKK